MNIYTALTDKQRVEMLVRIVGSYLTEEQMNAFIDSRTQIDKWNDKDEYFIIDLISVLYDGLVYGNWSPSMV